MIYFFKNRLLQIIFICIYVIPAYAQTSSGDDPSFLKYIKEQYKTNDVLVNGKELLPDNPQINKHPYLLTENWTAADIYIKGEVFYNQNVRYNVYSDQLILQFLKPQGLSGAVVIDNQMVDSIYINGHLLVSVKQLPNVNIDKRFVEVIEDDGLKYCIAYHKDYIRMYSTLNPYGKYSDLKKSSYLEKDTNLFKVNKRWRFLRLFPENKKEIRRFLRRHDIKYKDATTSQIKLLIEYCNELD